MASNPDTFYLTVEEYRTQTTVPALVGSADSPVLSGEEVTALLLETMALIDAYIGEGWTPYDDDQEFIFPRCNDEDSSGAVEIPRPVSLATRMIADAVLKRRQKGVLPHEVASEGNLGHSYSKHTRTIEPDQGFDVFPPEVLGLLQKYKRTGGYLGVNDPACDCSVV